MSANAKMERNDLDI